MYTICFVYLYNVIINFLFYWKKYGTQFKILESAESAPKALFPGTMPVLCMLLLYMSMIFDRTLHENLPITRVVYYICHNVCLHINR